MSNIYRVLLLFVAVSGLAFAWDGGRDYQPDCNVRAPEIDANSAGSALAMLSGVLLIVRGRRTK